MSKILAGVESVSNAKDIDVDVIYGAIEQALRAAVIKRANEEIDVKVVLDRKEGSYEVFRVWTVVEDDALENEAIEMPLTKAKALDATLQVGSQHEELTERSVKMGRIEAQIVKQVIIQVLREEERRKEVDLYKSRIGEIFTGQVKRVTRNGLIIDLPAGTEAIMPTEEMIPREAFRMGDRVRGYLYDVQQQTRGPQLMLSRACSELLIELFKVEVPEIQEEVILIKSAARDPGLRAKIAVKTNDGRIDPIGACVGMRGARVQAVSGELAQERIDIVLWDDNPAQFAINAMSPAEISSIVVDENAHAMDIAVREDQLSQAIGRGGQNVRLASKLTGWTLNVMTESDAVQKQQDESATYRNVFVEALDIDQEVGDIIVREGFTTLKEVAYVALEELSGIPEFDEEIATELQSRAREIVIREEEARAKPAEDLLNLAGMTPELANELAERGVITQEDLAELAVDELNDIEGMDEVKAGDLIMAARAPWFEESKD